MINHIATVLSKGTAPYTEATYPRRRVAMLVSIDKLTSILDGVLKVGQYWVEGPLAEWIYLTRNLNQA